MTKLDEREAASDGTSIKNVPSLAVQFFLIPLAVVGVVVLIYGGFRMLVMDERTPEEYLNDVRVGGRERRWPAAYELSRLLADPGIQGQYPGIGSAVVDAFAGSEGDDPRVRRYLALAVGRLAVLPENAVRELLTGLEDPDSETVISVIWALAATGDSAVVDPLEKMYESDDAGIRKMTVYALGVLPSSAEAETLQRALIDEVPDVRWNAALALARHRREEGVTVLRQMLDREYVERNVSRTPARSANIDPVAEVMVSSLQAVGVLQAIEFRSEVVRLSENDASLRVREVAMKTLEML
tara:strand:- start:21825 stop:22718 length:894 start_codon:yes stop_codon:yes gene_type:complete